MRKQSEKSKDGKHLKTTFCNAAGKTNSSRRGQWLEILKTTIFAAAALIVLVAAATAWFASNKEVSASDSTVTSAEPNTNLYIRLAGDEKEFLSKVEKSWEGASEGLYPISTANCKDWYYVSTWKLEETNDPDKRTVKGTYTPATFNKATLDKEVGREGLYTNVWGESRRAWFSTTYNLYTSGENLDIYLNPNTPIDVTTGNTQLDQAIRVALVDGTTGQPLLIYAPESETVFYAVTDTNTVSEQTDIKVGKEGLADYTAVSSGKTYTKGNIPICTATSDGVNIIVYVWLEGTDTQAEIGQSDNETTGINISVNFVGVEASKS
ncbi:MAG: hypothetical protein ACI4TK_06590 [Agathobacter sp.]